MRINCSAARASCSTRRHPRVEDHGCTTRRAAHRHIRVRATSTSRPRRSQRGTSSSRRPTPLGVEVTKASPHPTCASTRRPRPPRASTIHAWSRASREGPMTPRPLGIVHSAAARALDDRCGTRTSSSVGDDAGLGSSGSDALWSLDTEIYVSDRRDVAVRARHPITDDGTAAAVLEQRGPPRSTGSRISSSARSPSRFTAGVVHVPI